MCLDIVSSLHDCLTAFRRSPIVCPPCVGDPRRNESLVKFLTSLSLDVDSSEAFKQARKAYLLGSTMSKCACWLLPVQITDSNPRIPILAFHALAATICGPVLERHHIALYRSPNGSFGRPSVYERSAPASLLHFDASFPVSMRRPTRHAPA